MEETKASYTKRFSTLKIGMLTQLVLIIYLLTFQYDILSSGEGWGIIALITLTLFSGIGMGIDYLFHRLIKNNYIYILSGTIILGINLLAFKPWYILH